MINRDNLETFTPENIHRLKLLDHVKGRLEGEYLTRRLHFADDYMVVCRQAYVQKTAGMSIQEWNINTGLLEKTVNVLGEVCLISPNKQYLAWTDGVHEATGKLHIQHWRTGETIFTKPDSAPLTFIQAGKHLLYGLNCTPVQTKGSWSDMVIIKFDLETGIEETFLTLPPQQTLFIAPKRRWYAIRAEGVSVFETATHTILYTIFPNDNHFFVRFAPNGRYILTADMWSTSELWDLESGRSLMTIDGYNADFSPDSRFISLNCSGELVIWNIPDNQIHMRFALGKDVHPVFSRDSRLLFVPCPDTNQTKIWDLDTKIHLTTVNIHLEWDNIVFNKEFNLLSLLMEDKSISLWGIEKGR